MSNARWIHNTKIPESTLRLAVVVVVVVVVVVAFASASERNQTTISCHCSHAASKIYARDLQRSQKKQEGSPLLAVSQKARASNI